MLTGFLTRPTRLTVEKIFEADAEIEDQVGSGVDKKQHILDSKDFIAQFAHRIIVVGMAAEPLPQCFFKHGNKLVPHP